jgi:hypothetical protein
VASVVCVSVPFPFLQYLSAICFHMSSRFSIIIVTIITFIIIIIIIVVDITITTIT